MLCVICTSVNMMSDEYLVECNIDDDEDEDDYEVRKIQPSPPPEFSSTPSITPQPSLMHIDIRDPCGVNKHLKVSVVHTWEWTCEYFIYNCVCKFLFIVTPDRLQWCFGRACIHAQLWPRVGLQQYCLWGNEAVGLPMPDDPVCCSHLLPMRLSLCPSGLYAYLVCSHCWFLIKAIVLEKKVTDYLSNLFLPLLFLIIRCVMPCIQVCHTCLPCVRSLWMSVVNIFLAPFCTSVARCCSGIHVLFSKEWWSTTKKERKRKTPLWDIQR